MFFTSAWCSGDEKEFKESIPFELLGESIQRYESNLQINVLILYGYEHLSDAYILRTNSLGLNFIDYSAVFYSLIESYPNIDRFYSQYERNCFLRWLAYKEFLKALPENIDQFWHIDSDVVFHTSLDSIANDTKGKTFVLQGCPMFTSVTDFMWFDIYECELKKLEYDIKGYSDDANKKKNFIKKNDSRLCNVSLYRNPIGSDQDFLAYLIGSETIPQDTAARIFDSSFFYMQNALTNINWLQPQIANGDYVFKEGCNKILSIDNKIVPFIHYQADFTLFSGLYYMTSNFFIFRFFFIKKWLFSYTIMENGLRINFMLKILRKILQEVHLIYSRNKVIKISLTVNDENKQMYITGVLNFINKITINNRLNSK